MYGVMWLLLAAGWLAGAEFLQNIVLTAPCCRIVYHKYLLYISYFI
jgi:hypothetical protein